MIIMIRSKYISEEPLTPSRNPERRKTPSALPRWSHRLPLPENILVEIGGARLHVVGGEFSQKNTPRRPAIDVGEVFGVQCIFVAENGSSGGRVLHGTASREGRHSHAHSPGVVHNILIVRQRKPVEVYTET